MNSRQTLTLVSAALIGLTAIVTLSEREPAAPKSERAPIAENDSSKIAQAPALREVPGRNVQDREEQDPAAPADRTTAPIAPQQVELWKGQALDAQRDLFEAMRSGDQEKIAAARRQMMALGQAAQSGLLRAPR